MKNCKFKIKVDAQLKRINKNIKHNGTKPPLESEHGHLGAIEILKILTKKKKEILIRAPRSRNIFNAIGVLNFQSITSNYISLNK